ncbi:MAG TPA: TetR/AcrR family transcriptional regulator [Candidatus Dormibacteraeota bacterium]
MTAPVVPTSPAEPPRRRTQQRSLVRRERLAAVAGELIVERGFDSLSVNELAQRCGISVGGMYRHIRTKADVLVMACESIYGGVLEEMTAAAGRHEDPEERLVAAVEAYLAACAANRSRILMTYREYGRLPAAARRRYMDREVAIAELLAGLVDAGVAGGRLRPVDSYVVAYDLVLLGHLPALKGWALRGRVGDAELARRQVELLLTSLRA